jgi:NAD(P)-dependent dehydrogenase (short-subunit alcohol dehydrogenase family)
MLGLGVPYDYKLSPQGIDRVFATNCVGHQVLVTLLLPLLKAAVATATNDVRIVVTSSSLHSLCRDIDFDDLTTPSRVKWPALFDGVWRYGRSKLGNILFSKELSHRLLQDSDAASSRIYVNSFFPGNIVTDQWASWDSYFGTLIGSLIRVVGSFFGQTPRQGATTALYLATSDDVRRKEYRGRYFIPVAKLCEPTSVGKDAALARNLWVCTTIDSQGWLVTLNFT